MCIFFPPFSTSLEVEMKREIEIMDILRQPNIYRSACFQLIMRTVVFLNNRYDLILKSEHIMRIQILVILLSLNFI